MKTEMIEERIRTLRCRMAGADQCIVQMLIGALNAGPFEQEKKEHAWAVDLLERVVSWAEKEYRDK